MPSLSSSARWSTGQTVSLFCSSPRKLYLKKIKYVLHDLQRITKRVRSLRTSVLKSDIYSIIELGYQGVTKRCRLSWLSNSGLVYEPKCGRGGEGLRDLSQCVHGAQIIFGDLTPYLTYVVYEISVQGPADM